MRFFWHRLYNYGRYILKYVNALQTGRVTVPEGDAACDGQFPNPHNGYNETIAFLRHFFNETDISDEQKTLRAVVLIGAHSLGLVLYPFLQ